MIALLTTAVAFLVELVKEHWILASILFLFTFSGSLLATCRHETPLVGEILFDAPEGERAPEAVPACQCPPASDAHSGAASSDSVRVDSILSTLYPSLSAHSVHVAVLEALHALFPADTVWVDDPHPGPPLVGGKDYREWRYYRGIRSAPHVSFKSHETTLNPAGAHSLHRALLRAERACPQGP